MISLTFRENSYATYEDFNTIEIAIGILRDRIYNLGYTEIPQYLANIRDWNSYLFYNELNDIETGIKNLGKYYYRPKGFKKAKIWKPNMPFSYEDINRWINNLNIIEQALNNDSNELYPRDDLYPSDTLLPH
jgi:hypothetical protein